MLLQMIKNASIGSHLKNQKKYLALVSIAILLFIIYNHVPPMCHQRPPSLPHFPKRINLDHEKDDEDVEKLYVDMHDIERWPPPHASLMSDRWIVVTSIFAPTPDIKKLAKIPGWKLVVVGDEKSPQHWK